MIKYWCVDRDISQNIDLTIRPLDSKDGHCFGYVIIDDGTLAARAEGALDKVKKELLAI